MDFRSLTSEFQDADRRHRREVRRIDARVIAERLSAPPRGRRRHRDDQVDARAVARGLARWTARCAVAALGIVALYFVVCVPLAWYQTTLLYWNGDDPSATSLPKGWAMHRYVSQDAGTQFASYVHRGRPGSPVVVYLHGRGEGFRIASWNVSGYVGRGWTVVIPEYPGFNGLKGRTTETVIKGEMAVVYQDLMDRGVAPGRILIHGNSLGAGPAMMLAQYPNGMLLLTAPVASMAEVVKDYLPYYPTILLRDKWDNLGRARTRYPSPAQVVHATDDWVVPVSQGRRLAEAAKARYREIPTGGHAIAGEGSMIGMDARGRFTIWDEPVARSGV